MGSVEHNYSQLPSLDNLSGHDSQRDGNAYDEKTPLLATTTLTGTEISGDDQEAESSFSFFKLPARSKYTLLLCSLSNLFVGCSFAILAPFFPKEAEKKGASSTVTGLIFSVFELVIFISSPLFGNFLTRIGTKFVFTAGICVGGCCSILFGLLDHCPPGNTFIAMCFACRCMEALALSAFITASFAILSNEFPKHVATVIGISETASGIGMMVGPAVGGVLYELNGYGLPFFVLGSLIIVCGLTLVIFLPEPQDKATNRKGSVFKLVGSPLTMISMTSVTVCALGISFLDPTLAKHLEPFNLSTSLVGLMFVIGPFFYALTSPMWGYLVDNKNFIGSLIVTGHLLYGISLLLIGPTPWVSALPFTVWMIVISTVLLGVSIGCVAVPNIKCMVKGALEVGFEDNLDTYAVVSGLFNSMFCLGAFTGPTLGGVMVSQFGFDLSASYVGAANLLLSFVAMVFFLRRHCKAKNTPASNPTPTSIAAPDSRVDGDGDSETGGSRDDNGFGPADPYLYQETGAVDNVNVNV